MNGFVAHNSPDPQPEPDETLTNHAFFPDINVLAFRTAMRVDNVCTQERAKESLEASIIEVNSRLAEWMQTQIDAGHATLSDVPEKTAMPDGTNEKLYTRAVYSLAKAELIEKYRDYDTTKTGSDNAEAVELTADDHRRNASWSINDLIGIPRTTVELI